LKAANPIPTMATMARITAPTTIVRRITFLLV
jgi:hypothetical protein